MSANCLSQAEAALSGIAVFGYVAASALQLTDSLKHDTWTVTFLTSLDLDPVAVLGAEAVAKAAAYEPIAVTHGSRRPIRSHSFAMAK